MMPYLLSNPQTGVRLVIWNQDGHNIRILEERAALVHVHE